MSARSIAGSAFAAKWSGPGKATAVGRGLSRGDRLYPLASRDLGGDPDRRRSADAVAAPAARDHGASWPRIEHVKIVRLHTRVPVVDPARITPSMVAALKVEGETTWVAMHANHPRELTPAGARRLRAAHRCRHSAGQPVGAAARRQRRRRDAGGVDAGVRRMPDQALLPAPRRSCAGHRAFAHDASSRARH